jgi:hypothetical protein
VGALNPNGTVTAGWPAAPDPSTALYSAGRSKAALFAVWWSTLVSFITS